MQLNRRHLLAAPLAALARPAKAQAPDAIKFTADFRLYGATAPFTYGVERGFFREQNIACTVDGSMGSADAVRRVAAGAYDFGCADASSVVEFATRNPGLGPKLVMSIYDTNAACIVSLKSKPIHAIKDLEGATVAISTGDAGSRILPVLLRLNNVDGAKINFKTVDPQLRDTMLVRRDVDAVIGFDYTALFDLIGNGIPKDQVELIHYSSIGFDFYGGGLIASRKWLEQNPALVSRVAIAVAKSWVGSIHDVKGAIASVQKREPLTDVPLETARLQYVLDEHVVDANTRKNGLGTLDLTRLQAGIKIVSEGFQLPTIIASTEIYDDRFMPPFEDRQI
jgi:NitT/TauT family transport system substrate-binding protein